MSSGVRTARADTQRGVPAIPGQRLDIGQLPPPETRPGARRSTSAAPGRQAHLCVSILGATTGSSMVATDTRGEIIFVNPGAEQMLGYTAAELVGQPHMVVHDAEQLRTRADEAGLPTERIVALGQGPEGRRDWDYVRKDGSRLTVSLVVTVMHDADGEMIGYLGVAEDVTESREAARRLGQALASEREAVRRHEALDRAKRDFVTTASHELRTPIASVLGYLELIREGAGGEVTLAQDSMLQRMERNGLRLMALVNDLLTLSCVRTGDLVVHRDEVDLRVVLSRALEGAGVLLEGRDLEVVVDAPRRMLVQGDAARLEQLVLNLLTNAIKFTPDRGVVTVSLRRTGQDYRLAVSDTGCGISPEDQAQIFATFFRSDSASPDAVQGAGLGLSIVWAIAQAHGGNVEVTSARGAGACFTVLLPRSR